MATNQEKQHLVDVLKHGVNTYTIHLTGYGGEIVLGSITPDQYQFWKDQDLHELVDDWDDSLDIPDKLRIFQSGSWHDCDNLLHETGVEFGNSCHVTVYDQNDTMVWESSLDMDSLEAAGLEPEGFAQSEFYLQYDSTATHAFMAQSIEKGTFFTGEFQTMGRFDPRKLSFSTRDIEGWELVDGVSYASEIIEDTGGYNTVGKSLELRVIEIKR